MREGDPVSGAGHVLARVRTGQIRPEDVRAAALVGVAEAREAFPDEPRSTDLEPPAIAEALGAYGVAPSVTVILVVVDHILSVPDRSMYRDEVPLRRTRHAALEWFQCQCDAHMSELETVLEEAWGTTTPEEASVWAAQAARDVSSDEMIRKVLVDGFRARLLGS